MCRMAISPNADFDTGLPAGVFLAAAAAAAEAEDGMRGCRDVGFVLPEMPALDKASDPRQEPQAETHVGVHATSSRQRPAAAAVFRIIGRAGRSKQTVKTLRAFATSCDNRQPTTDRRQTDRTQIQCKVKKRETMGDLFRLQRPMLFGDIYDEEDDGDERVTSGRNSHFDRFELTGREDGAPDEETKRPSKRLPLQTYRPIRVG